MAVVLGGQPQVSQLKYDCNTVHILNPRRTVLCGYVTHVRLMVYLHVGMKFSLLYNPLLNTF